MCQYKRGPLLRSPHPLPRSRSRSMPSVQYGRGQPSVRPRPSVQFPGATERAKKREGPRRKRTPTRERRVFTFNYGSKKGPRGIEAPRSEERNCAVTKGEPFRHNSFWGISASSQLESITLAVSIDRSNARERLGNPMRPFSAYSSPERWLSLNRRRRPNHSCTLRGAAALV